MAEIQICQISETYPAATILLLLNDNERNLSSAFGEKRTILSFGIWCCFCCALRLFQFRARVHKNQMLYTPLHPAEHPGEPALVQVHLAARALVGGAAL